MRVKQVIKASLHELYEYQLNYLDEIRIGTRFWTKNKMKHISQIIEMIKEDRFDKMEEILLHELS